jgi:predicted Na+-dependent transporter
MTAATGGNTALAILLTLSSNMLGELLVQFQKLRVVAFAPHSY